MQVQQAATKAPFFTMNLTSIINKILAVSSNRFITSLAFHRVLRSGVGSPLSVGSRDSHRTSGVYCWLAADRALIMPLSVAGVAPS